MARTNEQPTNLGSSSVDNNSSSFVWEENLNDLNTTSRVRVCPNFGPVTISDSFEFDGVSSKYVFGEDLSDESFSIFFYENNGKLVGDDRYEDVVPTSYGVING